MGLLKTLACLAAVQAGKTPIPVELQSFYYERVYMVKFDVTRRIDNTVIIPPGCEPWPIIKMDVLSKPQSRAFLEQYKLDDLVETLREVALPDYKEENVNAAKTGGSSTISLTVGVNRRQGVVVQYYIWQKKFGYIWEIPYAGSFRFSPVVDAFFAPGVEIYTLDLEVVGFDVSFEAEAAAWLFTLEYLGPEGRDLILQLPMGRKPVDGLSEKQERALRKMRRDNPDHPAVGLLDLDPGEEFSLHVSKLGKLEGEQLETFRNAVNGGLAMNNHPAIGTGYMSFQKGNTLAKKFGFKSGHPWSFTAGAPGVGQNRYAYDWSSTVHKSKLSQRVHC